MKQYNIELAKALQHLEEDSGRVRFVGGGWWEGLVFWRRRSTWRHPATAALRLSDCPNPRDILKHVELNEIPKNPSSLVQFGHR